MGRNYLRDAHSKGVAYAEERLRETLERGLKYSESLKQNCAMVTSIVKLLMKIKELRDRINRGEPIEDLKYLIGDIGQGYVKLYLEHSIKETVSMLTDIPKEELRVEGPFGRGPDFRVYHNDEMVAIVELKSTTDSERYSRRSFMEGAEEQLRAHELIARVDSAFETEDGKLIVVEVKSVTKFSNIPKQYDEAIESLEKYKEQINEYGLTLKKGLPPRKDVEAYIACLTSFHKAFGQGRETKMGGSYR